MSKLKNSYGFSDNVLKTIQDIHFGNKPIEEARTALNKTYPYGANDMATLAVQIRALLNFLSRSGVLKKAMREHTELVEAYIGHEITEKTLNEMDILLSTIIEQLQQVKPNEANPNLKIPCKECGVSKTAPNILADLSAKPGTYICKSCAGDQK